MAKTAFGDALLKREGVRVWVSDFGYFPIPPRFASVRMTRSGWPDRRTRDYSVFMGWVRSQEQKARNA